MSHVYVYPYTVKTALLSNILYYVTLILISHHSAFHIN